MNAATGRPGVAAFDFDGTLIRGDSLLPFLIRAVGSRTFASVVSRAAPALVAAYHQGHRDAAKAVLLRRLLDGYPVRQLEALGQRYGVHLAQRIRPAMAERLAWHRRQGHCLIMVSASLDVYLAPAGRMLGFDHVLATRLEAGADGCLSGRLQGANVRGREKARRLQACLAAALPSADYELWAYGDSHGDREMLALADHPVMRA